MVDDELARSRVVGPTLTGTTHNDRIGARREHVGVDVANASVMVVEHAERFGLAQLHQLRGRIGRGEHDSHCLLLADPVTAEATERLKAVVSTNDGFKIAQHDLEIRGPGRFFGRHQHGLNELKVANPLTQLEILELARKEAIEHL